MARLAVAVAVLALIAAASAAPWALVRVRSSVSAAGSVYSGSVNFESNSTHTWVTVNVDMGNANANKQMGIHIHQFADMVTLATDSAFDAGNKTFGTHWQGAGSTTFGCPETNTFPNYRAGCLGNWDTDSSGVINQVKYFPIEQIAPTASPLTGASSSPIGLGLIIHANTDPCNGTSTLYGARLAGGVIGSANGARNVTSFTGSKTLLTATCRFIGTDNSSFAYAGVRGSVWFRQNSLNSISIRANISGIDLGASLARSMHIHDYGDLSDLANGLKTGGHWNPFGANHSIPNDEPRHAGDLGRITTLSNGNIWYEYTFTSSAGSNQYHPLLSDPYSVLGRGMILHAGRDEGCAAPTSNGNAGTRAAQCVIGLARDEVWDELNAVWPMNLPMAPQIGRAACTAPVATPVAAPVGAKAPVKAGSAGIVVPSIFGFLLAVVALLF
eukprot:TRINITY_DN1553_c1_g1_i1.p1 TRINITY_DN1553_c1_g1~~TRINITY_DN1553_c1_g1_i1.p1  ORF type:complete len:442 (+),score=121.07 TRINITY_DN1553_c1_g1_i1:924-2249(+)